MGGRQRVPLRSSAQQTTCRGQDTRGQEKITQKKHEEQSHDFTDGQESSFSTKSSGKSHSGELEYPEGYCLNNWEEFIPGQNTAWAFRHKASK